MTSGGRQYGAGRPPLRDEIENLDFIDAGHWHRNKAVAYLACLKRLQPGFALGPSWRCCRRPPAS